MKKNLFIIKSSYRKTLIILFLLGVVLYISCKNYKESSAAISNKSILDTVTMTIVLSPNMPYDVNNPSNLAEAANFAWNEFIAVTWPAMPQGPVSFPRGRPLTNGKYGQKGPTGQVVWETFRHRTEAFPGQGNPNGYDPSKTDYGFNSKPRYTYSAGDEGVPPNGIISPYFKDSDTSQAVFNNLDEVTQISLNSMYAGRYGHTKSGPPDMSTSFKEKILFEAKVNEDYYQYIAKNKYFQSEETTVQNIKSNSQGYAITGDAKSYPPPYTNLPSSNAVSRQIGSIEIKAAWRRLDPATEDINKFYTAVVRYYTGTVGVGQETVKGYINSNDPEVKEIWGLVALHIIHKTPNAPAFIYATFSHFDNILDSAGNSVEDKDGTTLPKYLKQEPFSPALNIINSSAPTNPQKVVVVSGKVNTNSPQLFFRNAGGMEAITDSATGKLYSKPVNINRRIYPIPPTVIQANRTAHDLIKKANPNAVWLNYKLVNVQAVPLDYDRDSTKIKNNLAATFFLANEVVETNPSLQHFSGGIIDSGRISNYTYNTYANKKEYDYNVFIRGKTTSVAYNMGGCMGCHGSQGQKMGGDFSVLLARGRIGFPDIVEVNENNKMLMRALAKKYGLIQPRKP